MNPLDAIARRLFRRPIDHRFGHMDNTIRLEPRNYTIGRPITMTAPNTRIIGTTTSPTGTKIGFYGTHPVHINHPTDPGPGAGLDVFLNGAYEEPGDYDVVTDIIAAADRARADAHWIPPWMTAVGWWHPPMYRPDGPTDGT